MFVEEILFQVHPHHDNVQEGACALHNPLELPLLLLLLIRVDQVVEVDDYEFGVLAGTLSDLLQILHQGISYAVEGHVVHGGQVGVIEVLA